jgi:hypothetical protein
LSEQSLRRIEASRIRQRMAGFDHFNAPSRLAVAVPGNDQTGKIGLRQLRFHTRCHRRCCLSRPDHDQALGTRFGQRFG